MSLKYQVEYYRYQLMYCRHNKIHRIDGPASIWNNGDLYWFQYGDRHRTDGPAEIWGENGSHISYYIRGNRITTRKV